MEEPEAKVTQLQEAVISIVTENQDTEVQKEANTSRENKNQNEVPEKDLASMFESSVAYRINSVPDDLRKLNERAYTPRLISIGPFHHFNKKLQTKEKLKIIYLQRFLERFMTPLEQLVTTLRDMEKKILYCYGDTIMARMTSDDFVKMILLDAIFILEVFIRSTNRECWESDDTLTKEFSVLMVDLVLLENQIPFFVIKKLFEIAIPNGSYGGHGNLIELTLCFFRNFDIEIKDRIEAEQIQHFTDLLRTILLSPSKSPLSTENWYDELQFSATLLKEAGVKFQVHSSKCLVDLQFENDVLKIPRVKLSNETEAIFQNIIAFEQTSCAGDELFTAYIAMLGSLIKTTKDMDLLCDHTIVVNSFRVSDVALLVVKKLSSSMANGSYNGSFKALNNVLNNFVYEHSWRILLHEWMKTLKLDYFSNPWKSAGTIAAVTLLVLTFIQTACSILQVK